MPTDNHIANINPFRYRSYYYDNETGFYYLQSRYYDPEIRRFISKDSVSLLPELAKVVGQLNLYAYCNNNPIKYTDPTGQFLFAIYFIALQAVITTLIYIGYCIASIFNDDIRQDMNDIGWNPFNSNAEIASRARKISFYKGVAVVRQELIGTCSFGAIWVNGEVDATTIQHEWGHSVQFMFMGPGNYAVGIALPSVINYYRAQNNFDVNDRYYSYPWERSADWLGGVDRNSYEDNSLLWAILYMILITVI